VYFFFLFNKTPRYYYTLYRCSICALFVILQTSTDDDQMLLPWPPCSPDATPCDLFLWGYVKDQVHVPPLPASIPELKIRIRTATETITADLLHTVRNVDYRVDVCRITKGAHIERAPVRYVTKTWSVVLLNLWRRNYFF
jgi:hypothetical protein